MEILIHMLVMYYKLPNPHGMLTLKTEALCLVSIKHLVKLLLPYNKQQIWITLLFFGSYSQRVWLLRPRPSIVLSYKETEKQ